jgi:hypothetical protein
VSKVNILLETTTVTESGDTEGTAIRCKRRYDEAGAIQYRLDAGTCDEIELQGRISDELGWVQIATSGALDSSGTDQVLQTGVAVMPHMRAVMKNAAGATAVVAFME